MKAKRILIFGLLLLGLALTLAACAPTATPCPECEEKVCPTAEPCPECPTCPAPDFSAVPYHDAWVGSPHNQSDAEAFRHWDAEDPAEVPTSCATCHSSQGYLDFLGADGSEAGKVDAAVPAADVHGITCDACHNATTSTLDTVSFPYTSKDADGNDVKATISGLGPEARCMVCHQGRESKSSVDAQIARFKIEDVDAVVAPIKDDQGNDVRFGFRNIHYYAAAATLYGTEVKGGYEYEGKLYDAKHDHVEGYDNCIGCHNSHTLELKVDECAICHGEEAKTEEGLWAIREPSSLMDYDGDGDVEEGMYYEIAGMQEILFDAIQEYATAVAGTGIVYDSANYPYFILDANGDGAGDTNDSGGFIGFNAWTARLLKAAYNYQVSMKDPGAYAHGNKYIVELLYDSIDDLNANLGTVDMTGMHREDSGHFAGNTMAFRDWDAEGEVPFRCVKCHTAGGLPEFIKNGGSVIVDSRGNTVTTGVGAMEPSNGLACSTCHDEANWPALYQVAQVTFPSGKTLSFAKDPDGKNIANESNLCISCHQGRESTASVNAYLAGKEDDTANTSLSFKNIHYLSAGATVFGADAAGAYQYPDKEYAGLTTHPVNKCADCHNVHALELNMESCETCHGGATDVTTIRFPLNTTDWDGDGDLTEGAADEIDTLTAALWSEIQKYAETTAGQPIVFDSHSYPYYFVDADKDGNVDKNDAGASVRFNAWTPRLMRAVFNYQYVLKDPGAYAHNPKYVMQFLYDSIEDLGGDVTTFTRP